MPFNPILVEDLDDGFTMFLGPDRAGNLLGHGMDDDRAVGAVDHTHLGRLTDAVAVARDEGHSWASIGAMVGTSGEAARQRYGQQVLGGLVSRRRAGFSLVGRARPRVAQRSRM